MARAVLTLTSSPSLRELPLLSFNVSTGTFLEAEITGICFVSHLGLQSVAKSTAYIVIVYYNLFILQLYPTYEKI